MDPHAARLENPVGTREFMRFEYGEQIVQAIQQRLRRCPGPWLEDHNAGALLLRKPKHMAEIMVECDECPTLFGACREQDVIRSTAWPLVP